VLFSGTKVRLALLHPNDATFTLDTKRGGKSDINNGYFSRDKESTSESEEQFVKGDAPKQAIVTGKRKADQKSIDATLLKSVEAVPISNALWLSQGHVFLNIVRSSTFDGLLSLRFYIGSKAKGK
jgi:hypothetical protein